MTRADARKRRSENDGPLCGWCASGKHTPSPSSLGCTRYHNSSTRPCPCDDNAHKEKTP